MVINGQFRDLDDPDRFVWVRSFADMAARRAALEAFYHGPVRQAHREAANATMIDSDDVLLLRPAGPGFPEATRPDTPTDRVILASIHRQELACFEAETAPSTKPLAYFRTEHAENDFPALPVRTDMDVVVAFHGFASQAECDAHIREHTWPAEHLRLAPTPRSILR